MLKGKSFTAYSGSAYVDSVIEFVEQMITQTKHLRLLKNSETSMNGPNVTEEASLSYDRSSETSILQADRNKYRVDFLRKTLFACLQKFPEQR